MILNSNEKGRTSFGTCPLRRETEQLQVNSQEPTEKKLKEEE